MRKLSDAQLLGVWERGLPQLPLQQALTLLNVSCPEIPIETLANLKIGLRDAFLLTMRERTFGSQMACLMTCPDCGERLELIFNVKDIRIGPESDASDVFALSLSDYEVHFRLPNSWDLVSIDDGEDINTAGDLLLERCILSARHEGEELSFDHLPSEILDAIVERMEEADPQGDIQFFLKCVVCGHQWKETFDIVSFFWTEIDAWARRILCEVHTLASAYGWHEDDILSMGPYKRQIYLEMVGG